MNDRDSQKERLQKISATVSRHLDLPPKARAIFVRQLANYEDEFIDLNLDKVLSAVKVHLEKIDSGPPSTTSRGGIYRPPGVVLARWAEAVYSKRAYTEVFEPIFSDLQYEYQEALAAKRWRKARWIAICGRGHFVAAALARIPISLTRLVVTLWKIGGS